MLGAIKTGDVTWISTTILVLVFGVMAAFLLVRRWLRIRGREDRVTPAAFTIEQLEKMRAAGQVSDKEYQVLRERILAIYDKKRLDISRADGSPRKGEGGKEAGPGKEATDGRNG